MGRTRRAARCPLRCSHSLRIRPRSTAPPGSTAPHSRSRRLPGRILHDEPRVLPRRRPSPGALLSAHPHGALLGTPLRPGIRRVELPRFHRARDDVFVPQQARRRRRCVLAQQLLPPRTALDTPALARRGATRDQRGTHFTIIMSAGVLRQQLARRLVGEVKLRPAGTRGFAAGEQSTPRRAVSRGERYRQRVRLALMSDKSCSSERTEASPPRSPLCVRRPARRPEEELLGDLQCR